MMNVRMKSLSKNSRQSGFELLRILMMLQVVFLHVCSKEMGAFTQIAEKMGGKRADCVESVFLYVTMPGARFCYDHRIFFCTKISQLEGYFSKIKTHLRDDVFL